MTNDLRMIRLIMGTRQWMTWHMSFRARGVLIARTSKEARSLTALVAASNEVEKEFDLMETAPNGSAEPFLRALRCFQVALKESAQ